MAKGKRNAHSKIARGLSVPGSGTLWRNNTTDVVYEVQGFNVSGVLLRAVGTDGLPIKITDLASFYSNHRYAGRSHDD